MFGGRVILRIDGPDSVRIRNWERKEMKRIALLLVTTVVALAMVSPLGVGMLTGNNANVQASKMSALAFHDEMRKLWEDHITWTRLAIIDLVTGANDTGPTVDRLLQNQADLGNAIKPFYGASAGNQLTALLKTHIVQAANIVIDAKAGNQAGVNENVTAWYANANEIAAFLTAANPSNWPLSATKSLMNMHLDLTLKEATAQLTGDYALSISTYENIHLEILQMADTLSLGLIKQFPQMFNGAGAFMRT